LETVLNSFAVAGQACPQPLKDQLQARLDRTVTSRAWSGVLTCKLEDYFGTYQIEDERVNVLGNLSRIALEPIA